MKISVIIPTYNRNKILCDTIQQILDQNYKDFELIVVDQSTQHDEYTSKYLTSLPEKVKIISPHNPNLPAARNIGIKVSKGDIILFIDDDMGIPVDTLSKVFKTFNDNKYISALTGQMLGVGNLGGYLFKKNLPKKLENENIIKVKHFLGGFMCFKKSLFAIAGDFDEWIGSQPTAAGEDLEFSLRLTKNRISLFLDKRIIVEHLGKSLIKGGYDKSSFTSSENKFWQMRNYLYILLKNKKINNVMGSFIAYWKVYRSTILNSGLLKKSLLEIISLHKNYFTVCKDVYPLQPSK